MVADEVHGFRYFDSRDLLGFVDGTENPTGADLTQSALIQSEDPPFEGGSYVVVQKYLHRLDKWRALETATKQQTIGPAIESGQYRAGGLGRESHKTLTTIVDAEGTEHDILRDNMPFGSPGRGEFGTYFIGYTRNLWVIEKMLANMFEGAAAGRYDRLLDFSTPMTGTTFFSSAVRIPCSKILADREDGRLELRETFIAVQRPDY